MTPLISHEQLSAAKRVLYMTHMAIGDYVYQRVFLQKLAENYPKLSIDLWFDNCINIDNNWNVRRAQTLTEWFQDEDFLHELYPVAASAKEREQLIARATAKNYDLIVFSVDMGCELYADIAVKIANKKAFVAGTLISPLKDFFRKIKAFRACNTFYIAPNTLSQRRREHITALYQYRFKKLFGLSTTHEETRPRMQIPKTWRDTMQTWLIQEKETHNAIGSTLFINYLASNIKRNWSLSQTIDLIIAWNKTHPHWTYIINSPPHELPIIEMALQSETALQDIHIIPFSAQHHFYELPALIQLSDHVFSVETAIMHLASALDIPQTVLIRRQAKTWAPWPDKKTQVIFTRRNQRYIKDITVVEVLERMEAAMKKIVS